MNLNTNKKIKLLLILLKLWIYIYIILRIDNIQICLCAIAKYENRYIIEFIEHYKKYGVDKIFLYDNNDINGENFDFLSEIYKNKYIEIINYRGIKAPQIKAYNDCYTKNSYKYNWLMFFDVDEYIYLKYYSIIKDFLSDAKFKKCKIIYLNWLTHTDNDLIFYDNRTLFKRFPKTIKNPNFCIGKSIIRGNLKNIRITSCHLLDIKLKRCDSFGTYFRPNLTACKTPDYKFNYIDHYKYKSSEEFIEKIKIKGDALIKDNERLRMQKINDYFSINKVTLEKIKYISKKLNLNATYIKSHFYHTE